MMIFDTLPARTRRGVLRVGALLLAALALATAIVAPAAAQQSVASDSARVEELDRWFIGIQKSKTSIPQSTLQNWVLAQEALRDLARIAAKDDAAPSTAWRARYVAAYGFWTLELFDVAAAMGRGLAASAPDDRERKRALEDLANALESAGSFADAAAESERMIASTDRPGMLELNNHALRLLKAGRYDEVPTYVARIELDEKAAHTRIFSARALAWRGLYDSARAELARACEAGEPAACSMIERLTSESSAEKYWNDDREYRTRVWRPYNRIDSSIALAARVPGTITERDGISAFAPSFWFNEIHLLYPGLDEGREIVPTYPAMLPAGRVGVGVIEGVPFLMIQTADGIDGTTVDKGVAAYLAQVHGPSAWGDDSMSIATRALVSPIEKRDGGGHGVVIVHTDWQEQHVRSNAQGATWRTIRPR